MNFLMRPVRLLFCASLAVSTLHATTLDVHLVKDFDVQPNAAASSAPARFVVAGDQVFFSATTPETGIELFVTDGAGSVPLLVRDFAPGGVSSNAMPVGTVNGKLIVAADDQIHGEQLWALPLTGGNPTRITSTSSNSTSGPFAVLQGSTDTRLFFSLRNDGILWATDGTPAATSRLTTIPSVWNSNPRSVCSIGTQAVVLVLDETYQWSIWRSDGTPNGASPLAAISGQSFNSYYGPFAARDQGTCYFLKTGPGGWALWRSDGTVQGTREVVANSTGAFPTGLAVLNGQLYIGTSTDSRSILWRSNGNDSTLTAIYDVPYNSGMAEMTVAGSYLAFLAAGGNGTRDVVVSDGTVAGTHVTVSPNNSFYGIQLTALGQKIFAADTNWSWLVDPATQEVTLLNASDFGLDTGRGDRLVDLHGIGIGAGIDNRGTELWRTNGTTAGTVRLQDIWSATADGAVRTETGEQNAIALGDILVLRNTPASYNGNPVFGISRTDGTAAGTWSLPAAAYAGGVVSGVATLGNDVAFVTTNFSTGGGIRLYRSDRNLQAASTISTHAFAVNLLSMGPGTGLLFTCDLPTDSYSLCSLRPGDTQPIAAFPQFGWSGFYPIGEIGGVGIFASTGPRAGLWRSDGTLPGTFKISELRLSLPGSNDGRQAPSIAQGGKLYFSACIGENQSCGLAFSNGSSAGTGLFGNVPSGVGAFAAIDSTHFAFTLRTSGYQLWSSDGSEQGTYLLYAVANVGSAALTSAGGMAHMIVEDFFGVETRYVTTNGSKGSITQVILPAGFDPTADVLAAVDDGTVLFSCTSAATGVELCATNAMGTLTQVVRDVYPGPTSSRPSWVGRTTTNGFFLANDGRHGIELWAIQVPDALFKNGFD